MEIFVIIIILMELRANRTICLIIKRNNSCSCYYLKRKKYYRVPNSSFVMIVLYSFKSYEAF